MNHYPNYLNRLYYKVLSGVIRTVRRRSSIRSRKGGNSSHFQSSPIEVFCGIKNTILDYPISLAHIRSDCQDEFYTNNCCAAARLKQRKLTDLGSVTMLAKEDIAI